MCFTCASIKSHLRFSCLQGVKAIYFSPLFESETHGYDTVDYYMIDRRIGNLPSFKSIVKELQALGIKV